MQNRGCCFVLYYGEEGLGQKQAARCIELMGWSYRLGLAQCVATSEMCNDAESVFQFISSGSKQHSMPLPASALILMTGSAQSR